MAMPQFVSLLVMRTFFDNYGPLQTLLANMGLLSGNAPMDLWKTEYSARMLIIFINMWVGIPYYMLLMSGLLINIPKGYYEAAKIAADYTVRCIENTADDPDHWYGAKFESVLPELIRSLMTFSRTREVSSQSVPITGT